MDNTHLVSDDDKKQNSERKPDTVVTRLIRLESKLVRGFEEMGITLTPDQDWLTVDEENLIVHIKTLGRSLSAILKRMNERGALSFGSFYKIKYRGKIIGTIAFDYQE